MTAIDSFAEFISGAAVPDAARDAAERAFVDTVGVILAGCREPAAEAVRAVAVAEGGAPSCQVLGTAVKTGAGPAALVNGTAAHGLEYDDFCFASLTHPSASLVPAALATGELIGTPGRAVLDAYVIGVEIEAVLGRAINPMHYQLGWHCTSTLGTIGTAAAVARILTLDRAATVACLSIAASEASGLKENFGTMVKPLHAGLAARNGVLAGLLAARGFTASAAAIDGAQGFVLAMSGARRDLRPGIAGLGRRWEIVETGITVKLYPSCAATHPMLDALLDLRREHGLNAADIERVEVAVDETTPTVLIYDRPITGLQGKFSLPYCAAAALAHGRVDIDTFEPARMSDPVVQDLVGRVTVRVDPALGRQAPPLTQAIVSLRLRDGRLLHRNANGARGYPERPASAEQMDEKFRACAGRVLPPGKVNEALARLRSLDTVADVRSVTELLATSAGT